MEEKDVLEEKINERKERFDDKKEKSKDKFEEKKEKSKDKFEEKKEKMEDKFEEKKEKGKIYSEMFVNDINSTIEEFKENFKNMQKYADEKINEYKNATVSNLAADLVETDETYYLKVAIPGISKEDVEIEAGDNDIVITTTFKPLIEELEEVEDVNVIASELTNGRCSKTVRFENSIDVENIKAKYNAGIVLITLPKLIIPKHKITVE
ncbi:Hsp20/alpha crystallin family protein [uncultured Methanobrevibacter sp.]|uniref:Hsp20/alpha crystallin family protein n=1 Tax=uncultured Methanobrevibacter sp. TaxID=253161 RepID=UPI0025F2EECA|nr:Hsp20/alpha crystallin family protein [uncultured Methanobrevibacter sp.]